MLSPRFKSLILIVFLGLLVSGCASTLGASDAELEALFDPGRTIDVADSRRALAMLSQRVHIE